MFLYKSYLVFNLFILVIRVPSWDFHVSALFLLPELLDMANSRLPKFIMEVAPPQFVTVIRHRTRKMLDTISEEDRDGSNNNDPLSSTSKSTPASIPADAMAAAAAASSSSATTVTANSQVYSQRSVQFSKFQ
ncbi:hypothetical protein DITRI_Ditri02bG0058800 [Diplodiscus trichospermus]